MANKKKNTAPALAEDQAEQQDISVEETATPAENHTEQNTPSEDQAIGQTEQDVTSEETADTADQKEDQAEQVVSIEETPCPFEATVSVALAVLRKTIGPGTADMLKPVATLKQGAKVTVTAINKGNARLSNGLWISIEYIAK